MPKYTLLTSFQDENNKMHEAGDTVTLSKEKALPLISNGTLASPEVVGADDDDDEDTESLLIEAEPSQHLEGTSK